MKNIILIPYRNREKHLKYWIENTYPKLNKVLENLEVLVIEQSEDNKLFNRGKVLNVGFKYYDKDEYNYFTHDVDINPYLQNKIDIYNLKLNNNSLLSILSAHKLSLGGIIKFNGNIFRKINGFRNDFWGWGIEDVDLYLRCIMNNINIIRINIGSKYGFNFRPHKHNGHEQDNNRNKKLVKLIKSNNNEEKMKYIKEDGLTNCNYKIIKETILQDNIKKITVQI